MRKIIVLLAVVSLILVGCSTQPKTVPEPAKPNPAVQTETNKSISLYYTDGTNLVKETRQVKLADGEQLEKRTMEELAKGPSNQSLKPTIPPGTKVNSVTVQGDAVTVDFSDEFVTNHWGGTDMEEMTIYSVVDTLTDLSNIKKVRFLVGGKEREVLKQMELQGDFTRDETLIKK